MEVIQLTAQGDLGGGIDEVDALAGSLSELDKMAQSFSLELFSDEIREAAAAAKQGRETIRTLGNSIKTQGQAAANAAKKGNSFLDYLKQQARLARKADQEVKALTRDLQALGRATVKGRSRDVFAEARSANLAQGPVPLPSEALKDAGGAARVARRDFGALATQFRDMDGVGLRLGDTIDQLGVAMSGGLGAAVAAGIVLFGAQKAAMEAVISVFNTYIEQNEEGAASAARLKSNSDQLQVSLVEQTNRIVDVNDVMGGASNILATMEKGLSKGTIAMDALNLEFFAFAHAFALVNPPLAVFLGVVDGLAIGNMLAASSTDSLAASLRGAASAAASAASGVGDLLSKLGGHIVDQAKGIVGVVVDAASKPKGRGGGGGGGRKKEIDIIHDLVKARMEELNAVREIQHLQEAGTLREVTRELGRAEKAHLKVADSIRLYAMELETARGPKLRRALKMEIEGLEQIEAKYRDNVDLLKARQKELRGVAKEVEKITQALAGTLSGVGDIEEGLKGAFSKIDDIEALRDSASNSFGLDFAMGLEEKLDALDLDPIARMTLEFELLGRAIQSVAKDSLKMLVEGLAGAGGEMFNMFGQMAAGAATAEDLGNSILGSFGDLAAQIGQFYILQGAAMMFMPGGFGAGLAMILGGAALQAFGGGLSGFAAGNSSGTSRSSGGSGGAGSRAQLRSQEQGATIIHLDARFGTKQIQGEVEGMVNDGAERGRVRVQSTGRRRVG